MKVGLIAISIVSLIMLTMNIAYCKPSTNEQRASELSSKAQHYLEIKRPELGLIDINKALELQPKNANFLLIKCCLLCNLEEDDAAMNTINKAIKLDPSDSNFLTMRAQLYMTMRPI